MSKGLNGSVQVPIHSGWRRDLPDPRDYTVENDQVFRLLANLPALNQLPSSVDLRGDADGEYLINVSQAGLLGRSAACAVASLAEYYERRVAGSSFSGSTQFLHEMSRFLSATNDRDASLRTHFKALKRYGMPPSDLVEALNLKDEEWWSDVRLLGFKREYESLVYFRLDTPFRSTEETFEWAKVLLASGFPLTAGISIPRSMDANEIFPYRPRYESYRGGLVVVLVGYVAERARSGYFLFRNSWGENWGEGGDGKLPFELVYRGLAVDFWSMIQPNWISSRCMKRPFYRP